MIGCLLEMDGIVPVNFILSRKIPKSMLYLISRCVLCSNLANIKLFSSLSGAESRCKYVKKTRTVVPRRSFCIVENFAFLYLSLSM